MGGCRLACHVLAVEPNEIDRIQRHTAVGPAQASRRLEPARRPCSRYAIDNFRRTKHGALVDAELLGEVYVDLIGARQSQLVLASETPEIRVGVSGDMPRRQRPEPLALRITEAEREAHRAFIATLGDRPIWNDYLPAA